MKITDGTVDVVFSRFMCVSFTITLRQKPKEVTSILSLCLVIQQVTPLDFCLRVIVNEKPLNLEKTTSSVLSVLLLTYGCRALCTLITASTPYTVFINTMDYPFESQRFSLYIKISSIFKEVSQRIRLLIYHSVSLMLFCSPLHVYFITVERVGFLKVE